jgi:hypothetical protein
MSSFTWTGPDVHQSLRIGWTYLVSKQTSCCCCGCCGCCGCCCCCCRCCFVHDPTFRLFQSISNIPQRDRSINGRYCFYSETNCKRSRAYRESEISQFSEWQLKFALPVNALRYMIVRFVPCPEDCKHQDTRVEVGRMPPPKKGTCP